MLFNSWQFVVFFAVVLIPYYFLRLRGQNLWLLLASYFFYGYVNWRFLGLILAFTAVNYTAARFMEQGDTRRRKIALTLGIGIDLAILGFFKYFNFFVDSVGSLIHTFGLQAHLPTLRLILPVGISFYTFQTIAYIVEVYRGRTQPVRDPLLFACYACYFPQLLAGPIERPGNLLPQWSARRRPSWQQFSSGAVLILIGLVRKVAIADVVAQEVDVAFAAPGAVSSLGLIGVALLYSLQIYCDFAGYSDMARGVSRMLGIELMENFQHPYLSTNITIFWHRWHVSLSSWLRDYVYIPLGGNRGPRWFVYRNLMLTFLLGGLWHGAGWTFVIWGGLHGLALVVHKMFLGDRKPVDRPECKGIGDYVRTALSWGLTMSVVALAWVFFRAASFGVVSEYLAGIVALRPGIPAKIAALAVSSLGLLLFLDLPQYRARDHTAMQRWHWVARGLAYAALIMALVVLRSEKNVPFIYFQF